MTAGGSAAARARALRGGLRGVLWRQVRAWLGLRPSRADRQAARWAHGASGEQHTALLLAQLETAGWQIRHDLAVPGRRFNLDHVLVSPCGRGVVVLDTKAWHRGRPTTLIGGRVHCGQEDRHRQVVAVAEHARLVAEAVGVPRAMVQPLLVVHGSPVADGYLEVPAGEEMVFVLDPAHLVRTLNAAAGQYDAWRSQALARAVFGVLRPYRE